ncbi:hypothetical protein CTAM01_00554 [Colletotrichum tamarilloi]|uniref:Zn(2)-C6 fungal-type domain-containing protein n=1 Tax=Colletotrichum tamarilloi TaxID=1209934 RepID=A0ABQ9RUW6_9PEZI|nr:uncharacterized protein CTAM01_00554 [Colletotrichum tamarilloi]KAK1513158.1 hypothetical protein CTAM01_00554 [Colletotrichum tamarilloi]
MIAECAGMREHGEADDEASSSSGDSEDGSEIVCQQNDIDKHEVEYHMFYVKATIARLIDLSTKIRQSGNKYRYHKADASLKEGDFIEYVQSWKSSILGSSLEKATAAVPYQTGAIADFLHESRLTTVQRRLIRANLLRRNRIQFIRESTEDHEATIEASIAETAMEFEPQPTQLETVDREFEAESQALPDNDMPVQASSKIVPSASHTATHIGSQFDLSIFLEEETSPSVVTRATRIGGRDDLEYPKCPKPSTVSSLLTCPYCANVLPEKCLMSQSLWRHPLFRSSSQNSDNSTANRIRTVGPCMRCRIQRIPCTAEGVCDRCVKAHPQKPESSCFRDDLIVIANNLAHLRFSGLDRNEEIEVKKFLRTIRPQYLEEIFKGAVVFTPGPPFQLPTTLRNYQCLDDMSRQIQSGCMFSREHGGVPSYQDLVRWTEQMILPEDRDTFEGSIENFINMYSSPMRSSSYIRRPQVHSMKCMYKICCQDDFIFIREDTGAVERLPLPAKAELRVIARMALEAAERDTLNALDNLKAAATRVPEQDLPALWATLWQLMFIYRDLLRNRAPRDNDAGALLNAVAIFYAAHFRTSASLGKLSLDSLQRHWGPGETQQAQLSGAFDHALSLRDTLRIDEIDHRLKALVVDPEMKVLGRRTNKKTSGGK